MRFSWNNPQAQCHQLLTRFFCSISDAVELGDLRSTQRRGVSGTLAPGTQDMFIAPSEVDAVLTTQETSAIGSAVTTSAAGLPKHKEGPSATSTSGQPVDTPGLSTVESVTMSHQGNGQAHPSFHKYYIL